MVIRVQNPRAWKRGTFMTEMMVAIAILVIVVMPVAYSFDKEQRLMRAYYHHAIAMEIVDGEMEVLMAGEWHNFTPGTHVYAVDAQSATNLPAGQFTLTVTTNKVRLEWQPQLKDFGGPVVREGAIP